MSSPLPCFLNHRFISKYDGQGIYLNNIIIYELSNYLGGGTSGSVYLGINNNLNSLNEKYSVAIKILNPVGFKLFPINQINKCDIIRKGLSSSLLLSNPSLSSFLLYF